jgi:hypothetical protein
MSPSVTLRESGRWLSPPSTHSQNPNLWVPPSHRPRPRPPRPPPLRTAHTALSHRSLTTPCPAARVSLTPLRTSLRPLSLSPLRTALTLSKKRCVGPPYDTPSGLVNLLPLSEGRYYADSFTAICFISLLYRIRRSAAYFSVTVTDFRGSSITSTQRGVPSS